MLNLISFHARLGAKSERTFSLLKTYIYHSHKRFPEILLHHVYFDSSYLNTKVSFIQHHQKSQY